MNLIRGEIQNGGRQLSVISLGPTIWKKLGGIFCTPFGTAGELIQERERKMEGLERLKHTYPQHPGPCHELGKLYAEAGEYDKALSEYGNAVRLHTIGPPEQLLCDIACAYEGKANAKERARNPLEARKLYEDAVKLLREVSTEQEEAGRLLGRLHKKLHRYGYSDYEFALLRDFGLTKIKVHA